jgi:hypothetical protein
VCGGQCRWREGAKGVKGGGRWVAPGSVADNNLSRLDDNTFTIHSFDETTKTT